MAFVLSCPHCSAKLRTRQRIAAGDPAVCPHCKKNFVAADIVEDSPGPIVPPPPAQSTTAPAAAKPTREDLPPPKQRDDTNDSPNRKWDDDDDSDSRYRRREDDDRPSRSRDRYDDDRSSRSRDQYDDDDRPRSRSHGSRPITAAMRRRRRGRNRAFIYFIVSFVGALSILGIVILIIYLARGSSDEELLAYMPADTHTLICVNMNALDKLRDSPFLGNDIPFAESNSGLPREDIDKILVGFSDKNGILFVVRLKSSFNKARFMDYFQAESRKENGKPYYYLKRDRMYAHLQSDSLLVGSDREDTLRDILRRERDKVVISESLRDLTKPVSSGDVWMASTQPARSPIGAMHMPGFLGGRGDGDLRGCGIAVNAGSDTMEVKIAFLCRNSDEASRISNRMQDEVDTARRRFDEVARDRALAHQEREELRDIMNSFSVDRSGAIVTIRVKGKSHWDRGNRNRDPFSLFR